MISLKKDAGGWTAVKGGHKERESHEVAHSIRMEGEESLLTKLSAGSYILSITFSPGALMNGVWPSGDMLHHSMFNVDMSIAPMAYMKDMVAVYGAQTSDCSHSVWPTFHPNRRGFFKYSADRLTCPPELATADARVQSSTFVLTKTSEVFFSVGYDFLLTDVALALHRLKGDEANDLYHERNDNDARSEEAVRAWYGTNHGNVHQLAATLDAGTYTLELRQPSLMDADLQHCLTYSMDVVLHAVENLHVKKCEQDTALPTDLNTQSGGSTPHGGPIFEGRLRMRLDGILLPIESDPALAADHASAPPVKERIVLSIEETSTIRVYVVTTGSERSARFNWALFDLGTGKELQALQSRRSPGMATALWQAEVAAAEEGRGMAIEITYDEMDHDAYCPRFDLKMEMSPTSEASSTFKCPEFPEWRFPKEIMAGYDQDHIAWYIGTELFTHTHHSSDWTHDITINAQEISELDITLGYKFIAVYMFMEVEGVSDPTFHASSRGDFVGARNSFGHKLVLTLNPGRYVVRLRVNSGYQHGTFCFPYVFDALLTNKDKSPVVVSVTPDSNLQVKQDSDLEIRVRFSKAVFNLFNEKISDMSSREATSLVTLEPESKKSGEHDISPVSFRAAGYGATYTAKFKASEMKPDSVVYVLKIATNVLHDHKGVKFQNLLPPSRFRVEPEGMGETRDWEPELPSDAKDHKVLAACGHGTPRPDGSCVCRHGFAGNDCSRCAEKFASKFNDGDLTCHIMCGRNGDTDKEKQHCKCHTGYQGHHCDLCASGYHDQNELTFDPLLCVKTKPTPSRMPSHPPSTKPSVKPSEAPMPSPPSAPPSAIEDTTRSRQSGPPAIPQKNVPGQELTQQTQKLAQKTYEVDCGPHGAAAPIWAEAPCICAHGFTGKFCDGCIPSFLTDDSIGKRRCMSKQGCASLMCGSKGSCLQPSPGVVECDCDGSLCDRCAPEFAGFPNCQTKQPCPYDCLNGGHCDHTRGACACRPHTSGRRCEVCTGPTCDVEASDIHLWIRYLGILTAVALLGGAALHFLIRYARKMGLGGGALSTFSDGR